MDKNHNYINKDNCNNSILKVNLSAISFYEKYFDNSNHFNRFIYDSYKDLDKFYKFLKNPSNNAVLSNSSSCCVVFSLKLLSGTVGNSNHWNLCSDVITKPLFVKYKQNERGYLSFLTNHTEVLKFGNLDRNNSFESLPNCNKHFNTLIKTDTFLLSIGVSIIKRSKLLYVGYGNKYLSSSDLFGKRLSLIISPDKNNDALNLESGLLFFDLKVKRAHLAPISHPIDANDKNIFLNQGSSIEDCLDHDDLLKDLPLDDYSTTPSSIYSLSDSSSVKQKRVVNKKKIPKPPKLKNDSILSNEPAVHVRNISHHSSAESHNSQSDSPKDTGPKNNEVHTELREIFNASSKYDKYINNIRVTFENDFVQLIESLESKKYANLSQNNINLLNVLNIETSGLKNYENAVSQAKFDYLNSIATDKFDFKIFLKFVNLSDDLTQNNDDGVESNDDRLDTSLNELFLFCNKLFPISSTNATYHNIWIKTRSTGCFENIIKIPVNTCGNKLVELFNYLSKISISSVQSVGLLVDLKLEVFSLQIFVSFLEDKIKNSFDLKTPFRLTDVVFTVNSVDFQSYFNDILDANESNRESLSFTMSSIRTLFGSNELVMDPIVPEGSEAVVRRNSSIWTNMMKTEVDNIKNKSFDSFLRFIWPAYSKQLA